MTMNLEQVELTEHGEGEGGLDRFPASRIEGLAEILNIVVGGIRTPAGINGKVMKAVGMYKADYIATADRTFLGFGTEGIVLVSIDVVDGNESGL